MTKNTQHYGPSAVREAIMAQNRKGAERRRKARIARRRRAR